MKTVTTVIAVLIALLGNVLAQEEETPATPVSRTPPPYPAECFAKLPADAPAQSVTLMFDITRQGDVENVRVREASDPCFEAVSIAAALQWKYEPRRVGGVRKSQTDMEVLLTFVIDNETLAEDYDARPAVRVPPRYPEKCMRRAKDEEAVLVGFDVSATGDTENIQVLESTNKCLNDAATESVARWKYRPKTVGGEAVSRRGVQTVITFMLGRSSQADYRMRSYVQRNLLRAQRYSKQPEKLEEAEAILDEVYEKYGESFSETELSAYHQVRAVVKINKKEYAAALDSLRIVHSLGRTSGEAREAIEDTIYQLEQILNVGPTAPVNDVGDEEPAPDGE
ncbi:energy transducer TonB [Marinicaulis aureus]|uniref:Energy transducer TonB n=1 Tax=Hyphococcus aureus TaxID=2666033 RepID=A0ABW1KVR4_9PROT